LLKFTQRGAVKPYGFIGTGDFLMKCFKNVLSAIYKKFHFIAEKRHNLQKKGDKENQ